jgi:tetratricopeptide (TPR) repeat protein
LSILLFGSAELSAQKKAKKSEISQKESIKFDRLFIDANKAKLLGEYEQAVKMFELCIKIDNSQAAPYYELGNLYMHFGEYESAEEFAQKAAKIDPGNFYYRLLYAEILKNNLQFDKVIHEYESIISDFPSKIDIYVDLALIYETKKDYAKAIDAYDRLEKNLGINEEVKLKKQYLYLKMGSVDKAAKETEELIAFQPDNVQYYLLLAEIYYANGQDDKALKVFKRAADLFPDNSYVHLSLSEFYRSKGQFEKALGHLKIAFADPSLNVDEKVKSILSYFDLADKERAYRQDIDDLGQILLKAHPNDARVLTLNGDIQMNQSNPKKARKYFMKAVQIDNSRYPIWNQLLILEADLDLFDTLAMHSQEAIDLFPNQPVCYYFLGYANSRMNKHEAAAESYTLGVNLVIDNNALRIQFYLGMAQEYNEMEEYAKSDQAFESVLSIDSNNTVALNNYSYFLSERGERLEQALIMSAKSNKIEPNQATYLDTYAWIFYKLKRYEDARIWLEKALKYGGDKSGVILEHMGDTYFQLNQADEAMIYWQKAKITGDTTELLDKKLKDKRLYE